MQSVNWLGMVALSTSGLLFCGLTYLRQRRVGPSLVILVGLVLGVGVGLAFRGSVEYVAPIGAIYVRIISAIVAPLIAFSILSSVTSLGSLTRLRTIGSRAGSGCC